MAARKRKEDETFEQYRASLKVEGLIDKLRALGRMFWSSSTGGTYRRDA